MGRGRVQVVPLVAGLALLGLLGVQGLEAAPASAQEVPGVTVPDLPLPTEKEALERPDTYSAGLLAQIRGERVEVTDERTPDSSTYANPDGTFTLEQSTEPANSPDENGELVPIETDVQPQPDGSVEVGPHPLSPVFAADSADDLVSLTTTAGALSFGFSTRQSAVTSEPAAEVLGPVDEGARRSRTPTASTRRTPSPFRRTRTPCSGCGAWTGLP